MKPNQLHKFGITGCEAPCGGHPMRELMDKVRDLEEEAEAYFAALDYAFDKFKTLEPPQPLPVARVHRWKNRK